MSGKNRNVSEWTSPEGIKMLKVEGNLVTQRDRHALNRMADSLAPSRYKVKWGQAYIVDLRRVENIGEQGFQALKHTINLFKILGGQVAVCANKELMENPLWRKNIPSTVQVFETFPEAARSFSLKTEAM
jgi:anti-anti-sigma regulatory factor